MDHHDAIQAGTVERYLLNQLPREERDRFEEHYFDCPECNQELRAGMLFLDQAKKTLADWKDSSSARKSSLGKPPLRRFSRPAFVVSLLALAALASVVAYQNAFLLPKLTARATLANTPRILPTLSLSAAKEGEKSLPSIQTDGRSFLLRFTIPGGNRHQAGFTNYLCSFYSPSGRLLWQTPVSTGQAKSTISLRIPNPRTGAGVYRFAVDGISGPTRTGLENYHFRIEHQG